MLVCVVFLFLVTIIGWIGRFGSITPMVLDKLFGITDYVSTKVPQDIGYAKEFVFPPNATIRDDTLMFYAGESQFALLRMHSQTNSIDGTPLSGFGTVQISIDGVPFGTAPSQGTRDLPISFSDPVDTKNRPAGAADYLWSPTIHALKVRPVSQPNNMIIVIDCLVQVANHKLQ